VDSDHSRQAEDRDVPTSRSDSSPGSATPEDAPYPWTARRAALVVAHPGHELRVHHWVELAKPSVLVLTDGSGRTGRSRLASTVRTLERAGARVGPVFGRYTDARIYDAMLAGGGPEFPALLDEIAAWLVSEEVDYVASDALEGYSTSHELCAHLAGAACLAARRRSGRAIRHFELTLTGPPDACPAEVRARAIRIALDDAAVARKRAAAEAYLELRREVDEALSRHGAGALATEWLRPVAARAGLTSDGAAVPFYETYGEAQVAAGHYRRVIRRDGHVLPLARMLWSHADDAGR
jgi:hypothetical protein